MNLKGEMLCLITNDIKPNFSELGRIYGLDRRTVKKKYLAVANNEEPIPKKKKGSKLDKHKDLIKQKLNIPGSNKKAVFMYLKTNVDDDIGSYSNFRKYTKNNEDFFIEKNSTPHLRFETQMGKQLQFDWKGPMKLTNSNGEVFEFYIFSATLGASRLHIFKYSKFMTLESVQRCLIEVFNDINGVPKECLTDNMSSIINNSKQDFSKEFKAFAKDMGFIPKKCKIFSPQTKR